MKHCVTESRIYESLHNVLEFENQNVGTVMLDNQPLFNPYEVGACLGMERETVRFHLTNMDEDERVLLKNSDVGLTNFRKLNNRGELFVTESGIYVLIFSSHKLEAKKFRKWVPMKCMGLKNQA
jgi:prophage antirepressor-like protein